jgi:hypothetical protein
MDTNARIGKAAANPGDGHKRSWPLGLSRQKTLAWAALIGLVVGASGSYAITALVLNDRLATLTQASDLRVRAADQHVEELQEQLRQFEEQARQREEQLVQEADAQQSRAVREVSEQGRALAQQQRAAIEQARAREQELAKQDLPLRIWVHRPLVGRGLVASMHNFGTKDLSLTLTAQRAASGDKQTWTALVPANATLPLGPAADSPIAPGDAIVATSDNYRPLNFEVPRRPRAPSEPH